MDSSASGRAAACPSSISPIVDMTPSRYLDSTSGRIGGRPGRRHCVLDDVTYFSRHGMEIVFRCHGRLAIHRQGLLLVMRRDHSLRRVLDIA